MSKKIIGWQKYEDFLEKQLSSPFLNTIASKIMSQYNNSNEEAYQDSENDLTYEEDDVEYEESSKFMFPMSAKLMEDLSLLSNYDCWMAHTNFDITHDIKNKLDYTEGIELLKVCSRYRFFIGVGKMFDFKQVRKNIEQNIT